MGIGLIWKIVSGFFGPFFTKVVGPFIKKYWKQIIIALIIGGTLWHIKNLNETIHERDTKIVQLTTELQRTKENLKTTQDTISDQNKKLQDAAKVAENNQKDLNTLGDKLKKEAANNKLQIDKLRNQPAPKTCDDVKKYLQDNLDKIQWSGS